MPDSQLVTTIKSGNIYLNIFLKKGSFGPYLEPSRPVYRYKNEEGETKFSEYLRDMHCLNAARCFSRAHDYIEDWRANKTKPRTDAPESELSDAELPSVEH